MTHDVRVLCRPEVAAGFALTGIPVVGAGSAQEAVDTFRTWIDDPDVGVVLMQQDFHDALPDDLGLHLRRHPLPMVVPFPGPSRAAAPEAEAYIVELLRQVIGYRVRLR
jgi:vacuolar-type H+-ATPase subunit F/Vma7